LRLENAAIAAVGDVSVDELRVSITSDQDIIAARHEGRVLAVELEFSPGDATLIATAISELARNIVSYARHGEIRMRPTKNGERPGIVIVAWDDGPGIQDVRQAMRDGFSTSGSLGLGLPGVRRLMDDFEIVSEQGKGTTVTVRKWKP
jgi:serine/threonine-protein kinase RsbT